ncbi:MAG: hypothetical protein HYT80_08410 [Euryarchaeota archaeon]|nr:hypothetical protein [Euryarchaeota archaeon]
MIIRFRRRLSRRRLLEELAKEHGAPEALRARAGKDSGKRAILEEWIFHLRARNMDETITLEHDIVFHDSKEFLRAWTPQRLALYEYLRSHRDVDSLRQLAKRLRRNYRNVYEDAQRLAKARVLSLERHANSLVPKVLADEITVTV